MTHRPNEGRTREVRTALEAFAAAQGTPQEQDAERRFREVARAAGLFVEAALYESCEPFDGREAA